MPKGLVQATMPEQFKRCYPTTRVIIDATEIYVEQPKLPELQQITFSNYKNDNTYKGLVTAVVSCVCVSVCLSVCPHTLFWQYAPLKV